MIVRLQLDMHRSNWCVASSSIRQGSLVLPFASPLTAPRNPAEKFHAGHNCIP